ncbi:MAG: hypothetical protein ACI4NE_04380 [Succinivibrio sp.]
MNDKLNQLAQNPNVAKLVTFAKNNMKAVIGGAVAVVAVIIALCFAFGSSVPNTPQGQFKAMIIKATHDNSMLDKIVKGFKVDSSKEDIIKDYYKSMFTEEFVDYYIQKLDEEGVFKTKKPDSKLLFARSFQIMNNVSIQGLKSLNPEDKYAVFVYNTYISKNLSPRVCKMYVVGDSRIYSTPEMQQIGTKVFKKMKNDELAAYFTAMRNASKAFISNEKPAVPLSDADKTKAQEILSKAMEKQIASLPQSLQTRVNRASDDLDKAMPHDACEFGKVVYDATLNIEDKNDRDLVIANLLAAE